MWLILLYVQLCLAAYRTTYNHSPKPQSNKPILPFNYYTAVPRVSLGGQSAVSAESIEGHPSIEQTLAQGLDLEDSGRWCEITCDPGREKEFRILTPQNEDETTDDGMYSLREMDESRFKAKLLEFIRPPNLLVFTLQDGTYTLTHDVCDPNQKLTIPVFFYYFDPRKDTYVLKYWECLPDILMVIFGALRTSPGTTAILTVLNATKVKTQLLELKLPPIRPALSTLPPALAREVVRWPNFGFGQLLRRPQKNKIELEVTAVGKSGRHITVKIPGCNEESQKKHCHL